jgi:hypothetical protein
MAGFVLPKDGDGEVTPHNHPDLIDDRRLIRRISGDYIVRDDNRGGNRISSAAFKNDPRRGYLSVDSENCITDKGADPVAWVTSPQWRGALVISVEHVRGIDPATTDKDRWLIGMVPLPDNGCHGAIWGKITAGQSNDLQRLSDWLVPIPGVEKLIPVNGE